MSVLVVDTNVVSILFNRLHRLRQACIEAVAGHQLVISFMTRAELLLWPVANNWGEARRSALERHTALYLTLYPDERTCAIWATIVDRCRRAGKPIHTADARIASLARQWSCPLVTTDFGDFAAVDDLDIVPIG
jgi:predicted nucleic acid-binding protein